MNQQTWLERQIEALSEADETSINISCIPTDSTLRHLTSIQAELTRLQALEQRTLAMPATERGTSKFDFAAYNRGTQEDRLRIIQDAWNASTDDHQKAFFEGIMFADSVGLEEHPEWFGHGCACDTCLSYGEA